MKKWKKISINDKINVGTLIQGYTYSAGDYHNDSKKIRKKYLGNPKLRTGIVIETFSNYIFKVQFWNSAATKPKYQNKANKINYKFKNTEKK